jgi:hypothetical protein
MEKQPTLTPSMSEGPPFADMGISGYKVLVEDQVAFLEALA